MRNVSLMGKIDTINLKLLSVEIIEVASPAIGCDLRGKGPLLETLLLILQLPLCSPLCYRIVVFECNFWVKFSFASVRVVCGRELCLLSNSRPGACGLYLLGFSGKRELLNFVSDEKSLAVPNPSYWDISISSLSR